MPRKATRKHALGTKASLLADGRFAIFYAKRSVPLLKSLQELWRTDRAVRHAEATGLVLGQMAGNPRFTVEHFLPVLMQFVLRKGPEGVDGLLLSAVSAAQILSPALYRRGIELFDLVDVGDYAARDGFGIFFADIGASLLPSSSSGGGADVLLTGFSDGLRPQMFDGGLVGGSARTPGPLGRDLRARTRPLRSFVNPNLAGSCENGFRTGGAVIGAMYGAQGGLLAGTNTTVVNDLRLGITPGGVTPAVSPMSIVKGGVQGIETGTQTGAEAGSSVGETVGDFVCGVMDWLFGAEEDDEIPPGGPSEPSPTFPDDTDGPPGDGDPGTDSNGGAATGGGEVGGDDDDGIGDANDDDADTDVGGVCDGGDEASGMPLPDQVGGAEGAEILSFLPARFSMVRPGVNPFVSLVNPRGGEAAPGTRVVPIDRRPFAGSGNIDPRDDAAPFGGVPGGRGFDVFGSLINPRGGEPR